MGTWITGICLLVILGITAYNVVKKNKSKRRGGGGSGCEGCSGCGDKGCDSREN